MSSFSAPELQSRYDADAAKELQALNPTWQQTMLRVKDPVKSLAFYRNHFGMTLLNEYHFGEGQGDFSLYFLATLPSSDMADEYPAMGSEDAHKRVFNCRKGLATLELTHNHGTENTPEAVLTRKDHADRPQMYANGNDDPRGFGHVAFNCRDVYAAAEQLEAQGVAFKKRPDEGRMKGLAFALDPDGYWVELVQGAQDQEPERFNLSQTMLRVQDAQQSVSFYRDLFGMQLVSERHFDADKGDFSLYFLATSTDTVRSLADSKTESIPKKMWDPCLELTWNHGTEKEDKSVYHNGNDTSFDGKENVPKGFGHVGFLVDDLDRFCEILDKLEVPFVKRPKDGKMHQLAFAKDPTGYWIEIIQRNPPMFK